jgi:hypothetical protein
VRREGKEKGKAMCLKTRTGALILVALLTLMLCATANAAFVRDLQGDLWGTGGLQHLSLYSLVTVDAGIYTYAYDLTYDQGTVLTAEVFSVSNWEDMPFLGTPNAPTNNKDFTNPVYTPADGQVRWFDGHIYKDETVHFTYQSVYAPSEIGVYAFTGDGGYYAEGEYAALGMTGVIPEPSSLAGLALAVFGFAPILRRRR